jgi:hypothetical protein
VAAEELALPPVDDVSTPKVTFEAPAAEPELVETPVDEAAAPIAEEGWEPAA